MAYCLTKPGLALVQRQPWPAHSLAPGPNWQIQNSLARTVVKAPKSCHITPILRSLHWLRIWTQYKLFSLTYKVLTTTQPPYLHNLIPIQRPRSTRSSSVVTLARPPSSSTSSSISYSPISSPITSSSSHSPHCTSAASARRISHIYLLRLPHQRGWNIDAANQGISNGHSL